MGRSNGYRPKAAVREEVLALRARLEELQDDQWVKASYIMQEITGLLGHNSGPMGGKIEPRTCRYCHHFGHTHQWCKVRVARERERDERDAQRMLAEDRARGIGEEVPDTEWVRWCGLAKEAYDELCAIKDKWSDVEWETEFRKRTGDFDHLNQRINTFRGPVAAHKLSRPIDVNPMSNSKIVDSLV